MRFPSSCIKNTVAAFCHFIHITMLISAKRQRSETDRSYIVGESHTQVPPLTAQTYEIYKNSMSTVCDIYWQPLS